MFEGVRDAAAATGLEAAIFQTLHVFAGYHPAAVGHRLFLRAQLDALRGWRHTAPVLNLKLCLLSGSRLPRWRCENSVRWAVL